MWHKISIEGCESSGEYRIKPRSLVTAINRSEIGMKVNKEQMRAMAEKSDAELWREICNIAKSHGISLPDTEPKKRILKRCGAHCSELRK